MTIRRAPPRPSAARMHPRFDEILTPEALAFVARLDGDSPVAAPSCWRRAGRAPAAISGGETPDFLRRHRRDPRGPDAGRSRPPAPGLADRRCEITGPTNRKMTMNALNSGAQGLDGRLRGRHRADLVQRHRRPAQPVRRDPRPGRLRDRRAARSTRSADTTPTLVVRPRGWHLCEKHISVDGRPLPASLVDFGLYFFHNAQAADRQRRRAVLLPAEAGIAPRGPAVERRLRAGAGAARTSRSAPSGRPS